MIKISLNLTRIPKDKIKPGKNGKYMDFVLFEKPDTYGNDGFVAVDVSKEERERGEKGAIVGNWRELSKAPSKRVESARKPQRPADDDLSDVPIPF